ncbi:MFS transporter [uncultured Jatrophihabitans sp.]|uniref:MFS transporter n=1 Tax=uncultured Jatrophihabitans sp. TaxID=1610747 RepID=UPI0035C9DED7
MTAAEVPPKPAEGRSLQLITTVLAIACGLTVANVYYAQPLLSLLSKSFHVSEGSATVVVTLTQIGYALGLLLLLPVGDLVENRMLVVRTLVVTALALVAAGASPVFGVFAAVSVVVGVTSVVAQILVPLAAHLAPQGHEGRYVGRVMSGLLLGILLARTLSSLVAEALGWRAVFFISAGLMAVLGLVLRSMLPARRPDHTQGYRSLLATVVELARTEPVLRRLALCQATMFGAFSAYWTAIAYELVDRHGFSQDEIGLFALVGAAGAAAAPVGGMLADRGYGRIARAGAFVLAAGAMALAGLGASSVVLLAVGGVALDFAVQCHQVMSQQVIYALRPAARARINTVYMTTVFVGGAISSAAAGALHDAYGWSGVMVYAAALPVGGLLLWATGRTTAPAGSDHRAGEPAR